MNARRTARRCDNEDTDAGRCQLTAGHSSRHAAAADGAYLTWDGFDVHRWGTLRRPAWLDIAPWAAGFEPGAGTARASKRPPTGNRTNTDS